MPITVSELDEACGIGAALLDGMALLLYAAEVMLPGCVPFFV